MELHRQQMVTATCVTRRTCTTVDTRVDANRPGVRRASVSSSWGSGGRLPRCGSAVRHPCSLAMFCHHPHEGRVHRAIIEQEESTSVAIDACSGAGLACTISDMRRNDAVDVLDDVRWFDPPILGRTPQPLP